MIEYKSIGEVSQITGLSKRTLKYYIEQKLIHPTIKDEKGYWCYNDKDIENIQRISLYKELGYSTKEIKEMITQKNFDWRVELDRQLPIIKKQKEKYECILFIAELLRHIDETTSEKQNFDISWFDNDIYTFIQKTKSELINNETLKIMQKAFNTKNNTTELSNKVLYFLEEMEPLWDEDPSSDLVQKNIHSLLIESNSIQDISVQDILFIFRVLSHLTGIELIVNILLGKSNAYQHLLEALQYYCDNSENPSKKTSHIFIMEEGETFEEK